VSAICRSATPDDLVNLLPSLDQEFVYAKQRHLSLATRFPTTFCAANAQNIFVCEDNGVIVSSLAIKHIEWQAYGQLWHGALLGAVFTVPSHRGKGKASQLLHWAANKLKSDGVDFAVLWTAQPAFYARLGWASADDGVLGELSGDSTATSLQNMLNTPSITNADREKIDLIRQGVGKTMIIRHSDDYSQIPIPAEAIDILWSQEEHQKFAYALCGTVGNIGIVYEMLGDKQCFPDLLMRLSAKHQRILINDCKGSDSYSWLSQHTPISWQNKPLAMWLALSEQLPVERIRSWYIPYFDRI
jgi:predicted N-acetyltransferase YhbS